MHVAHTLQTTAPAERIWQLWTDVAGWPRWDTALVAARLDGPFVCGARGRLQSKGSPESTFNISLAKRASTDPATRRSSHVLRRALTAVGVVINYRTKGR